MFSKKLLILPVFLILLLAIPYFFNPLASLKNIKTNILGEAVKPTPPPPDYRIVFVGDSMTEYLGNFDELRSYLKEYYPTKEILLLNYGYSATNILSVQERIDKDTFHSGRVFEAVNKIPFDLIFIESFGHNPLSQYPIEEGLKKQTEALDKIVSSLRSNHDRSKIIFMTTISPNKYRYGQGVVDLEPSSREQWAHERTQYFKNHIKYANDNQIPLLNVFEKSLGKDGTGKVEYIKTEDFIHPSPKGIYFISEEIAKFIFDNKLLK